MNIKKNQGFTLIEVMIALFIFAIIMAIATSGLSIVIKTKERLDNYSDQIEELQIASLLISQDIQHAVNRSIKNERGDTQLGFRGTLQNQPYLEFTRMGYTNPLSAMPRSSLQRVAYQFKNKQFIRISWPVLDRAPTTQPIRDVILTSVDTINIRYLAANNQFYDVWPPPLVNYSALDQPLPKAVEMTFYFGKAGVVNRLFLLGGSGFLD